MEIFECPKLLFIFIEYSENPQYRKKGIINGKIRRISEYYANGDMSKEDFDRMKSELELKLKNI